MSTLTIPNALSFFRLFGSPLLLPLSQTANQFWVVIWFVLLGLSDALDGALARRWNQTSDYGSKLDAIADLVFYPCSALVLAILFPSYLSPNLPYIYVTLTALAGALLISRIRCGRVIMLHTHISRYSGVLLFVVMLASFVIDTTLLIRLVALTYAVGFIEASLIFIIKGPVSPDTRGLFSR
ncbi:MAG: CDP-alcohol phosphatidyltransferase family protein [Gammaproteobacteria bacterium]